MHRATTISFGVLLSLALAGAAGAAQGKPSFESLDKDGNGKVSVNEATENDALFIAFKNLDRDKNGELTREEFDRYQAGGASG